MAIVDVWNAKALLTKFVIVRPAKIYLWLSIIYQLLVIYGCLLSIIQYFIISFAVWLKRVGHFIS